MREGFVVPVDHVEIARLSAYDPWQEDEPDSSSREREALDFETLEPFLEQLPPREADCFALYYRDGKRQQEIAEIFGVTQAAVSYRLDRARERIRFLLSTPRFTANELRADLAELFTDVAECRKCVAADHIGCARCYMENVLECPVCDGERAFRIDLEILVIMAETTCQTVVAERLGITAGRGRHRFVKALARLARAAELDSKFEPHHRLFATIADENWNVLRECPQPRWTPEARAKREDRLVTPH